MSCILPTSYHWNPAGPLHHVNQPRRRNSRKVSKPYKTYVGHKKEISMENIVHAQPHNGTCTPHKVVVDRIGDQALTHASACVGYSINNEHVFLTTVHGSQVWDLVHAPPKHVDVQNPSFCAALVHGLRILRFLARVSQPNGYGQPLSRRVWVRALFEARYCVRTDMLIVNRACCARWPKYHCLVGDSVNHRIRWCALLK